MENKILEKAMDASVNTADKHYDVVTERLTSRMEQAENDIEKDKSAAHKIIDKMIETTEE